MTEKNYYPEGAYNDPKAPWNQVDNPEREVEVTISVTLSKIEKIKVVDYNIIDSGHDKNGELFEDIDYSDCNLQEEVESQVYLPQEIPFFLRNSGVTEMEELADEYEGWNVDDFTVTLEN